MTTLYPNQPGYLTYHDPTKVDFRKTSYAQQDRILFGEIRQPKSIPLPNQITPPEPRMKIGNSYSQDIFKNPYGEEIKEQYQPDFVKLDKQVLRFYG